VICSALLAGFLDPVFNFDRFPVVINLLLARPALITEFECSAFGPPGKRHRVRQTVVGGELAEASDKVTWKFILDLEGGSTQLEVNQS
jgi:hypothetical protein